MLSRLGPASFAAALLLVSVSAQAPREVVRLVRTHAIEVPGGATMAAGFSPDGARLASGGTLGDLILWEVRSGKQLWRQWPSDHWIGEVAFAPDGRHIAAMGRHLTVHDPRTGKERWRREDTGPHGLAWSPDGARLAVALGAKVEVCDSERGTGIASFPVAASAVAFSKDGRSLFAGGNAGTVHRVQVADGKIEVLQQADAGPTESAWCQKIDATGPDLLVAGWRGDVRRGEQWLTHPETAYAMAVAPGAEAFAVGGEKTLSWWTRGGDERLQLPVPGGCMALAFHPDGRTLLVSTGRGDNALYRDGVRMAQLPGHKAAPGSIALSPDATVLALGGSRLLLQPLDGGEVLEMDLGDPVMVAVGRSGDEILVQGRRLSARSGHTGKTLSDWPLPENLVGAMYGPAGGGTAALSCSIRWPGVVTRWDLRDGAAMQLGSFIENTCDAAFAADGCFAIGGVEGDSGALSVFDQAGKLLHHKEDGPVATVAFSPDGKHLASATTVRIRGFATGKGTLTIRNAATFAVERSTSALVHWWRYLDDHLALAYDGTALQVWDVDALAPVQSIAIVPLCDLRLSADRRTLAVTTHRDAQVFRITRGD